MYTWSGRSTPSCTWPWVKPRTESHTAHIPSARTKASSLSETGDLQGSIWRPGHRVSRLDDLEMKNASNARPSPGLLARADKLDTFLPLCLPLSSLPVWLCHSSSLLPLCLPPAPRSLICSSPSPLAGERQRRDSGDRIRCLSASSGRAWRSSAYGRGVKQRVTRSRSWRTSCKSVWPCSDTHARTHTHISSLLFVIVPASALSNYLTHLIHPFLAAAA